MYEVVVYGRDNPFCKFCAAAKNLLTLKEIPFRYLKLGEDYTKEELLEKFPGAQSVPQIVINWFDIQTEEYVGGFTNLEKLVDNGHFRE